MQTKKYQKMTKKHEYLKKTQNRTEMTRNNKEIGNTTNRTTPQKWHTKHQTHTVKHSKIQKSQ